MLALVNAFPFNFYLPILIIIFASEAPVLCTSSKPYWHPVFWQGTPPAPDSGGSGPSSPAPCHPALSGMASKEPRTPQLASQWILFSLWINFPLCWSSTKGGEATSPPGAQDPTDLKTARWPQGDRLPLHCWIDKMEGQEICNHRVSQWRPTCQATLILGHNKCIQKNGLILFNQEFFLSQQILLVLSWEVCGRKCTLIGSIIFENISNKIVFELQFNISQIKLCILGVCGFPSDCVGR